MTLETVAVIGSGTMGSGIAQVTALAGYKVVLYDLNDDLLRSAVKSIQQSIDKGVARGKTDAAAAERAKGLIEINVDRQKAVQNADLVIEAAPERLDLKRELFAEFDEHAPAHAILASNTSSLSISAMAAATNRPSQVVGLHFFNPAHIMKLVEIVRAPTTSDETVATCRQFAESLGKTTVLCKDTPAFIVNRVARPFYGEAFRLLGEDVASVETIDRLVESVGFRMGPFRLVDLIGCDVNFAVTQSVYNAYFQEPRYRPHPIQRRMVESGWLGRKSGRGFYDYDEGE